MRKGAKHVIWLIISTSMLYFISTRLYGCITRPKPKTGNVIDKYQYARGRAVSRVYYYLVIDSMGYNNEMKVNADQFIQYKIGSFYP